MPREFVTAINCMDGRVQEPVINWMKKNFDAKYVDMITEAGPNKVLLNGSESVVSHIRRRVEVSRDEHGSEILAIVGHHNCAGHRVQDSYKKRKIKDSVKKLSEWNLDMHIIGLFVNKDWEVQLIIESTSYVDVAKSG